MEALQKGWKVEPLKQFLGKELACSREALSLESEACQAEVASTFTATVAVKSISVEAVGIRIWIAGLNSTARDGGAGPSSETNRQIKPK